ncbi:hypothetical protein ACOMHN_016839 [Nucella lapillus]
MVAPELFEEKKYNFRQTTICIVIILKTVCTPTQEVPASLQATLGGMYPQPPEGNPQEAILCPRYTVTSPRTLSTFTQAPTTVTVLSMTGPPSLRPLQQLPSSQ